MFSAFRMEECATECFLALRIRRFLRPSEGLELFFPTFTNCFNELWIAMAHEVREGCFLAVLLTHEQHRHIRPEQCKGCNHSECIEVHERAEAIARQTVADLVMVLCAYDKLSR